jgi:hypothetical protein
MVDVNEVKNRIVNFLKLHGPSIPIQIAKDLKTNSIFTSAFLGELLDEKRIKTSTLRVGGTPLYLLAEQSHLLENFQKFLHPKEQEAFNLLKNSKILKDSEQQPAIRVALRSIKDFAIPFKKDNEIHWRYLTVSEKEVISLLEPDKNKSESIEKKEEQKEIAEKPVETKEEPKEIEKLKETIEKPIEIKEEQKEIVEKPKEIIEKSIEIKEKPKIIIEKPKLEKVHSKKIDESKTLAEFNNPLIIKQEPKPVKIRPKSEYVEKVIRFLEKNNFKIIEEKEYRNKEYNCIAQLDTNLGPINFLTQSKDKKTIPDSDLDKLLRSAQEIPLPALFIYPGGLSKKAIEYQQKYYSILKTKKI